MAFAIKTLSSESHAPASGSAVGRPNLVYDGD
jgi:hypothetical protein